MHSPIAQRLVLLYNWFHKQGRRSRWLISLGTWRWMMMQVQIPKGFFNDHADRDLPTPAVISETKRHYTIDTQDPAFAELVDDAEYYAGNGNDAPLWLKSAATALLRATKLQQQERVHG